MPTKAIASEKKSRRRASHACVFDVGQVAELNALAYRIELFGKLVVNMLEGEQKEERATVIELVYTTIKEATAIQALVECGEKTARPWIKDSKDSAERFES